MLCECNNDSDGSEDLQSQEDLGIVDYEGSE